jgi:hypothetical protein
VHGISPASGQIATTPDAAPLCHEIKTLIEKARHAEAKAQQFYTSAGQKIEELKKLFPDNWETLVKKQCGLGRSRAYEILAIADGRTTVEGQQAKTNERSRRHDAKLKTSVANGLPSVAPKENAVEKTETETKVEVDDPEATAKKPNGSSTEDDALFEFAAHVLELLRLTRGHEAKRFAGTAIKADELARLTRFLTILAITVAGDPAPTPPTGAKRVETAPSVEPSVGNPEELAAKVAELVATFPSDLAIPPFLIRTPPVVDVVAIEVEPIAVPAPGPLTPPPTPTPSPSPSPSPAVPKAMTISTHYLPAHRDPWPKNWKTLDANELEQVIRKTQEFGVNHQLEDRHHAQLKRMRERLVVLRQADRAATRSTAQSATTH